MANETIHLPQDSGYENGYGYTQGNCVVGYDIWGFPSGNANGALRFTNITINRSASINEAKLYYDISTGHGSGSERWKFNFFGIDEDNTGNFSGNPFGRPRTSATINIDQGVPDNNGYVIFDVKSIVEEITSRGSWNSGNALGFFMFNYGTDSDVMGFCAEETSYFAYRVSAEPNFTPTPISVTAPSLPTVENYGIRISKPGTNVLTASDSDLYFTTRKKQLKVLSQGYLTSTTNNEVFTIAHNLGYVPLVMVYLKASSTGDDWERLPIPNHISFDYGVFYTNTTNLVINSAVSGEEFYYYIFLDPIA